MDSDSYANYKDIVIPIRPKKPIGMDSDSYTNYKDVVIPIRPKKPIGMDSDSYTNYKDIVHLLVTTLPLIQFLLHYSPVFINGPVLDREQHLLKMPRH